MTNFLTLAAPSSTPLPKMGHLDWLEVASPTTRDRKCPAPPVMLVIQQANRGWSSGSSAKVISWLFVKFAFSDFQL
jgi:hypothetical protein